jgi:ankyrin repeat protein
MKAFEAVRDNEFDEMVRLLEQGAHVDSNGGSGVTLLLRALADGNGRIARYLIDQGADVQALDYSKNSALDYAVRSGDASLLVLLFETGVNFETAERKGTPLISAATWGHSEAIAILVRKGADVNYQNWSGLSALHMAISNRHSEAVRVLLESGADVNLANKAGMSLIHLAAELSSDEILVRLLGKKAKVDVEDDGGQYPMHYVAYQDRLPALEMLLDAGGSAGAMDSRGATLAHAAAWGGQLEVLRYLLGKGVDKRGADNAGHTLLHEAVQGARDRLRASRASSRSGPHSRSFRSRPADVPARYGSRSLRDVPFGDHKAVIEYLVEQGLNTEAKDKQGKSGLALAKEYGLEGLYSALGGGWW